MENYKSKFFRCLLITLASIVAYRLIGFVYNNDQRGEDVTVFIFVIPALCGIIFGILGTFIYAAKYLDQKSKTNPSPTDKALTAILILSAAALVYGYYWLGANT